MSRNMGKRLLALVLMLGLTFSNGMMLSAFAQGTTGMAMGESRIFRQPSTGTMTIGGTSGYDLAIDHMGMGWSWVAATSTLTLASTYTGQEIYLQCAGTDTTYVEYSGDVTINGRLWNDGSMDIRTTGADTDRLTVNGGGTAISPERDLAIHSGTIVANGPGNSAIHASGSVSILGSATVEATGGMNGDIFSNGTVKFDTTGSVALNHSGGNYISDSATVAYVKGTVVTGGVPAIAPSVSGASTIAMAMGATETRTVDFGAGYFAAVGCNVLSGDTGIATVEAAGNVLTITGISQGTTSITVTWGGGKLAGQTVSISVEVAAPWGVDGIFDLSALPSINMNSADVNTPWSWDKTAQALTLTGPGPYTMQGAANGTARIIATMSQDMQINIDGHLQAPGVVIFGDGHSALTASGTGNLTLTGTGSLVGGDNIGFWAGHGVNASGLSGNVFISGSLGITGGYGACGGIGVRISGSDITLSGTVALTGGAASAEAAGGHGIYHASPNGKILVSGQITITGGNGGTLFQYGAAIGGTGNSATSVVYFIDEDASLSVTNGASVTSVTQRAFVNNTFDTNWDIDALAILSPGTASDQTITVNIPASPDSLVISLVAAAPPSIVTGPVNQTVTEGGMATFSVVATGAQISLYQWQVDKQDGHGFQLVTAGSGADTASYTTQPTNAAMSGYQYRVVLSNPVGSTFSHAASLTVNASGGQGGNVVDNNILVPSLPTGYQPTIGSVSGKTTGTAEHKTFTITDSMVKAALEKAWAEAKAQKRTAYGVGVKIMLDAPAAEGLTITIERAALSRLVKEGAKRLEVSGIPTGIAFDQNAIDALHTQGSGDVVLDMQSVAIKGVRGAYDITITTVKDAKAVDITSLGIGTATLYIPCATGEDEAAGYLHAVTVDNKGKISRIPNSVYDANSGSVIFGTSHFSVYGVGYTEPGAAFTDVEDHWAKEAIEYVVGRGLLGGVSDTTFAPNAAITRGEFIAALGKVAGVDTSAYTTSSFVDVEPNQSYAPYIEWAYKMQIAKGMSSTQFAPDRVITRQEMALMLKNYAKATSFALPIIRTAVTFEDNDLIGSAYQKAVAAMQQAGVVMGGAHQYFHPTSNTTRAEASAMLHRYIKLTIDPNTAQGWALNDDGQQFYFKAGKALTGTQTIDKVKYEFDTTGVLQID